MTLAELYKEEKTKREPLKVLRIPSRSHKGEFHLVEWWGGNNFNCDCPKAIFGKTSCWHITTAKARLKQEGFIK